MVTNSDRQPTQFRDEAPENFELAGSNCQDSDLGLEQFPSKPPTENFAGSSAGCRTCIAHRIGVVEPILGGGTSRL